MDQDEWVFDTIRPSTARSQVSTSTQRRRKPSRVPSRSQSPPATMLQELDLNAGPLGVPSPMVLRNQNETARIVPSSQQSTTKRVPSETPTARKVSEQKGPLSLDMSFGNGTSTVRQFRRVSAENALPPVDKPPKHLKPSPLDLVQMEYDTENTPPAGGKPRCTIQRVDSAFDEGKTQPDPEFNTNPYPSPAPPQPAVSKEALLGRRAFSKVLDTVFQEAYAQTADQRKREALAAVANAWAHLDKVDPEGEFLLLRSMMEGLGRDSRLTAALSVPAPSTPLSTAVAEKPATTAIPAPAIPPTPTREAQRSPSKERSKLPLPQTPRHKPTPSMPSTPTPSPQKKFVLAQGNPHLKNHQHHQRRQSAVPVSSTSAQHLRDMDEKRLPGYIHPGLEHQGQLAEVLYGRWLEGLKSRWPVS